ncbi:MAG: histidine kinase [Rhodococcus sp. (in: high G+C Gram-positive bacteria)]
MTRACSVTGTDTSADSITTRSSLWMTTRHGRPWWNRLVHSLRDTIQRRSSSDAVVAAGLFVVGLVLYLSGLYPLGTGPSDVPLPIRITILALMCGAGLLRRRHPSAALTLGLALFVVDLSLGPSVPAWIVLADLLYAAVLYGSARFSRWTIYGTGVSVGALAAVFLVATDDVRFTAGAVVVSSLFFGTSVWWGLSIRRQKEITAMEQERSRAHRALAELDRDFAVAHERNAMARELHDVIAGHLSAIAIHSEVALSADPDQPVRPLLEAIRAGSTSGLAEMRSMIDVLSATDLDGRTSAPRIADLDIVIDAARAAGSDVTAAVDTSWDPLPSIVDHAAYRIAHEALTNAMKHAPGVPIQLGIGTAGRSLRVIVRNPVAEQSVARPHGSHGLANMRHRAHLLGGELDAGIDGSEWVVTATLPLDHGEPT